MEEKKLDSIRLVVAREFDRLGLEIQASSIVLRSPDAMPVWAQMQPLRKRLPVQASVLSVILQSRAYRVHAQSRRSLGGGGQSGW